MPHLAGGQLFCLDPDGAKVELDFDGAEAGQVDGMKPSTTALAPMTEADYAAFVDESIASYAADKVASGQWAQEESLELSRQAFGELLPAGLAHGFAPVRLHTESD